jgi:pyruvate/2-oxoglutarate dehydrogenase complex dihydrolipoamide acyltransferase (E2) component
VNDSRDRATGTAPQAIRGTERGSSPPACEAKSGVTIRPLTRARRHTWHFLRFVRGASPVYIDTEIDATELVHHKRAAERAYSVVSYVIHGIARVLTEFPDANAACAGLLRPRIATRASVDVKLTLDKRIAGERAVLTVVMPGIDRTDLAGIQDTVDRFRNSAGSDIPELRGTRTLQRIPFPLGRAVFGWAIRLRRRHDRLGTVSVTSLGHRPVYRFFSSGGTALTFGIGQITEKPVVRNGKIRQAPILPVSLTFDHRVLDGALAADVLTALKIKLEAFGAGGPHTTAKTPSETTGPFV